MRTIPANEFPRLPEPGEGAVVLPAEAFAEALRQVTVAASTEETRPILTGVQMSAEADGLRLVATDSYRLAVRDLPGTSVLAEGQSVLVPSGALKELGRLLAGATEVTLTLGERDATFVVGNDRLTTRLIEGEFPNYRGLIPASQPNRLAVAREPLLEALRRVRLLATDATPVRLVLKPDGLELVAIAQEVGQAHEEIDAKYEGAELTVAFNPDYLIAGIEVTPGDEITLETTDSMKPALAALDRELGLPVPADAGPGLLRRALGARGWSWPARELTRGATAPPVAHRLPVLPPGRGRLPGRAHRHRRRQRRGQDQPARGRGLPGHPRLLPRARRSRPWCVRAAPAATVRAAGRPGGPRAAHRGRAGGQGPQPDPGQPPTPDPVAGPARRAAGVGLLARRPGPGQGRPGRTAPLPRRRAWWPRSPAWTRFAPR